MVKTDYLVTTTYRSRARTRIWDGESRFDIECWPRCVLDVDSEYVRIKRGTSELTSELRSHSKFPKSSLAKGPKFTLPTGERNEEIIEVSILPVAHPKPIYAVGTRFSIDPQSDVIQPYLFYGVGEGLLGQMSFDDSFEITIGSHKLLQTKLTFTDWRVESYEPGMQIEPPGGKCIALEPHRPIVVSFDKLLNSVIRWNDYWWRPAAIVVPQYGDIPHVPSSKSRSEHRTLKRVSVAVGSVAATLLLLVGLLGPTREKPATVVRTRVALREPKWLPPKPKPLESKVLPKPKPVVAKPQVKRAKPGAERPKQGVRQPNAAEIRADKVPQAARTRRPQDKIARASKPTTAATPASNALQTAQAKSEISKALGFLSPSKHRAKAGDPLGTSTVDQKFSTEPARIGLNSSKGPLNLSESVKGPISTKGSRSLSGDFQVSRDRASGKLRGRVALESVHRGSSSISSSGTPSLSIRGSGQLKQQDIQKALEAHLQNFQYCYEKALLSDPSYAGVVRMEWTIEPSGRTTGVRVASSQINNAELSKCLVREISKIEFPRPSGGSVIIEYPFAFESGSL